MSQSDAVQRLQIRFAAQGPLRYISHLDLMRVWERVFKRAGLPLATSHGFSPRPKIALAAPLAVGVTSDAELLDVLLTERVDAGETMLSLNGELTPGLRVIELREGPLKQSSLQSMLRAACYVVDAHDSRSHAEWQAAIVRLLAADEIPWSHQRGKETKSYDLRPLILKISLIGIADGVATLSMRLRNDERGAGRPEQVMLALGATEEPTRIHRTAIELAGEPVMA
ncbi:MAG: TIGR03936 family radical SAM-associated protein [Chloroflexota bacterium]|nr:TIGR03936 family radical SAM-associated protein [Chloroflexota bacterium]